MEFYSLVCSETYKLFTRVDKTHLIYYDISFCQTVLTELQCENTGPFTNYQNIYFQQIDVNLKRFVCIDIHFCEVSNSNDKI